MSNLENKMSPMQTTQQQQQNSHQQQQQQQQNELTNDKIINDQVVVADSGNDSAESSSSLTRVTSTNDINKTSIDTETVAITSIPNKTTPNDTISAAADSSDNQIQNQQQQKINHEPQTNNNHAYNEHMQQQPIYIPTTPSATLPLMYQNNIYASTSNVDEQQQQQQNYINYYNNYNENYYQQQHQQTQSSLYTQTNNLRYNPYNLPIPTTVNQQQQTTSTPTNNIISDDNKSKILSPSLVSSSSPNVNVPPTTTLSPNKWQCKKCGVCTFNNENDLNEHITNIHGASPYGSSSGYSSSPFIKEELTNGSNPTPTICNLSNILDLDSQKMVYPVQQQQQQMPPHNQTIGPLIQQPLLNDPLHSMHSMQQRQLPIWEQHQTQQRNNNYYDTATPITRDDITIKNECTTTDYVEQLENSDKMTISNSPTEFPSTTTTSANDANNLLDQQPARVLEPPTSSSNVSGNIGSKASTWKSNEARRPKTYNCTACNKWFTSSGHLKRHYNTTLHKNAVKSSNQPDPATLPISVHHHPARDPNSKHNRRNNNAANIKQQQQQQHQKSTASNINQQAASSFIPIQLANNVDVNNFTNGHPNALAGPSDQLTTTITTTSSNMRGLLSNNNNNIIINNNSQQQHIIKEEQIEVEEELQQTEQQSMREQQQQLQQETSEKIQLMEKQQIAYQQQLLVQEYQEQQHQEQTQLQQHYNQQQERIITSPPVHIIYRQPYLLEQTTQQQIMNSNTNFCREQGIQHLQMLPNNTMEQRICNNNNINSSNNNNIHMDIHMHNNNMHLSPITHIATSRHMEEQQLPQSQQPSDIIMLDSNNPQLIHQPLTTPMKILSSTNMEVEELQQQQDHHQQQHQQQELVEAEEQQQQQPTVQLQYIHNNTLHNNINAHNNIAISCHPTIPTNTITTNINRHSIITQPQLLPPQQQLQRRLPITAHTPIIPCFQQLQHQTASTLIPLEPTMTYHTIIGNQQNPAHHSHPEFQQTNDLTTLDTVTSQQIIQTSDGQIFQIIQGNPTSTSYGNLQENNNSYTPISIRDERSSPQEADLPPISKNQQETAVLRNGSPTISSSSWLNKDNEPQQQQHQQQQQLNINDNSNNINMKRKSCDVDSSITTTKLPLAKRKRINNKSSNIQNKNQRTTITNSNSSTVNVGLGTGTTIITNNGRIKCLECDKEFTKICYLTQHNKSFHSGEYPYRCQKCGKRFQAEDVYTLHVGRHKSQDKPHKCDICPKQFHHKTDLRRHIEAIHTGLKQHACNLCDKSFCRKDHLRKHIETHTRTRLTDNKKSQNQTSSLNTQRKKLTNITTTNHNNNNNNNNNHTIIIDNNEQNFNVKIEYNDNIIVDDSYLMLDDDENDIVC